MDKYNWFANHEGELGFTVRHTEGDVETLIAVTDTAEKAHLITARLNQKPEEYPEPAEELLKPYRKQSRNGVLDWVSHEDAVKVLDKVLRERAMVVQLYDGVVQNWKDSEIDIRDLNKQLELKDVSNLTVMIKNRDLEKWKEEAMIVMKDIPEIGRIMGVPLGQTIHDKILTNIRTLQHENEKFKEVLFPGAFLWWVHEQGWHKHSSGEYYYKSKDFHQWPPDESITIEELKVQFKAAYKL